MVFAADSKHHGHLVGAARRELATSAALYARKQDVDVDVAIIRDKRLRESVVRRRSATRWTFGILSPGEHEPANSASLGPSGNLVDEITGGQRPWQCLLLVLHPRAAPGPSLWVDGADGDHVYGQHGIHIYKIKDLQSLVTVRPETQSERTRVNHQE